MAKTPLSEMERVGRKVSKVLGDIATKLDKIKAVDAIQPFRVPEFEKLDDAIDREFQKVESVKKVWKDYGENLEKVARRRAEMLRQLKQGAESLKKLKAEQDKLAKSTGKLSDEEKERKKELPGLIEEQHEYNVQISKYIKNLKDLKPFAEAARKSGTAFIDSAATKALSVSLGLVTAGFEYLKSSLESVYDMANRFRAAQAGMAEAIGVSTGNLVDLQAAAMETYSSDKGLGYLGMSLPEIADSFSGLASSMQYTDVIMAKDFETATKLSKAFGLTADELGNVLRANKFMGVSFKQQQSDMRQVEYAAGKLNMNVKQLQKDVFVTGKNLLDMAGPKFRQQMIQSIERVRAMGLSVQSLEKFTDMTDVFDTAVESMAKLNTAFGLHINALEMFDEQDPAKRLQMVSDQLRIQGKTYETMNRQQKKFLATQLGISMEETNALLQGKDMTKVMLEQEKVADTLDSMMDGLRKTLANTAQMMDRIYIAVAKALAPAFKTFFGIDISNGADKVKGFAEVLGKITTKITEFIDSLSKRKDFQQSMDRIALKIKEVFDWLAKPENWEKIIKFIENVTVGMAKAAEVAAQLSPAISPILWTLGQMVRYITDFAAIWASIKIPAWLSKLTGLFGKKGAEAAAGGAGGAAAGAGGGAAAGAAGGVGKSLLKGVGGRLVKGIGGGIGGIAVDLGMSALTGEKMNWGRSIFSAIGGTLGAAGAGMLAAPTGPGALLAGAAGGAAGSAGGGMLYDALFGGPEIEGIPQRAAGGPTTPNVPYLVGERGPERFVPSTGGTIVPNNQLSQPIIVQVLLDGEMIQDRMYKANLRSG